MTTTKGIPSNAGKVSALEHAVNGEPILGSSAAEADSDAAPAAVRRRRRDRGGHHRRQVPTQTISHRKISQDRRARLRLLAGTLIGSGCLVLASYLQPGER